GWEFILKHKAEGDAVSGKVTRKIKGGLLVDIGVPAFLPASQVDIRRPGDISEYIGQEIEAEILKIDEDRRNIVVSRRKLMEHQRSAAKEQLMADIEIDQVRDGVVKNIADFGVFVDLGGLDGLLHITDMSWGRLGHPSEMVKLEEPLKVKVLNIDREKEKVALGLKQLTENPWQRVEEHYPVGTKVHGSVVSLMSYGVFVKIEEGLEGLVHISEMSWTRRINHPSELVNEGEEIDVIVLDIDKDKQEISLGMKQAEENPWAVVKEKYPPGTVITGAVQNMTSFGAFVEIEPGIDGMLHVSDLSWTRKISHPSEMLEKGQQLQCVVLAVDEEKMRVSLGLKQLSEDPWLRMIPDNYLPGQIVQGHVTKITNFGVFVELEEGLEGLLHISELSEQKVENPQDVVKPGDELEVKILRVDNDERKIGLSLKRAQRGDEDMTDATADADSGEDRTHLRGGLGSDGGALAELKDRIISSTRKQDDAAASTEAPAEAAPEAETEPEAPAEAPAEAAPEAEPEAEADKPADA
ncbi:MAG: 30S ribosomal protein S1, partial [Planctomycetota bacterium]